jgi:hypothetical protein
MQQINSSSEISSHDLKKIVLEAIKQKKSGINHEDILSSLPYQRNAIFEAINSLLDSSKIEVNKDPYTNRVFYNHINE